jgi:O-antigen/teichoic acid export membrane protein
MRADWLLVVRKRSVALNALANVLQTLFGAILLFALYRYINSTLGVEMLGVWSVVLATASASRLASLGLGSGVIYFVARERERKDSERAGRMIDTATLTLMVLVGAVLPLLYPLLSALLPHLFDGEYLVQANEILPYALVSFWLSITASVFQGGLDGCHRMDLRAGLMVTGQVLLLIFSIWLVPDFGLIGLAWAQIGQGLFLVVVGRMLLRYTLPVLPFFPIHWSKLLLRKMLGYGVNVQVADLFMLMLDPVAKALMASFGGAAAAGYFEMANQVILKVRGFIVTANSAVVPHVAALSHRQPDRIADLYLENLRVLIFITLPVFTLLFAWSGAISWLLVGVYESQFVFLLGMLAVAWGANIFAAPAYFANLGSGNVSWNTVAHVTMGLLNAFFGWLLGSHYGAEGIVIAYAIALVSGSGILIAAFQKINAPGWRWVLLAEHSGLIFVCSIVVILSWLSPLDLSLNDFTMATLGALSTPVLLFVAVWLHPIRKKLFAWIFPAQEKG